MDAIITVLVAMLGGALRVSTPFLFVSLGECLTERAGRINLGNEGVMVFGAMIAYAISYETGSPWLGVLVAALCGMLIGGVHGLVCGLRGVNDVAMGIAIMLAGTGLAFFFGKPYVQPSRAAAAEHRLRLLGREPATAERAVGQPAAAARHRRRPSPWPGCSARRGSGLRVRIVGESEDAARALGLPVERMRFLATAAGSGLAGIGGAFLSLCYPASWNEGLSSGQGLMAVALVVFARWNPVHCITAALLFGAAGALGPSLQTIGITWGYYLFYAAPYAVTLAILIATVRPDRGRTFDGR